MPIYEFKCCSCAFTFDVRRSVADMDNPARCSQCDSLDTKRNSVTPFAFLRQTGKGEGMTTIGNRAVGISLEGGDVTLIGNRFHGLGTAIRAKDSKVRGRDNILSANDVGIDADGADIRLDKTQIE